MKTWDGKSTPPNELAPAWDAAEASNEARAIRIEGQVDLMLDECKSYKYAERLIIDYELIETNAAIISAIANWSGRSEDANELVKKLHNILAEGLQEIAESEVE